MKVHIEIRHVTGVHCAGLIPACHPCAGVMRSFEDIAGSGGLSAAATNVVLAQRLTRDGPILVSLGKSNIVDQTKFQTKEISNPPGQPMEFRDRIVSSPVRDTAVQRAVQEIQRVLFSLDERGKEMPWADIVKYRNPSVNDRAMLRARTRMQEEGQLFKRPVYGNTCVYSLTESQVQILSFDSLQMTWLSKWLLAECVRRPFHFEVIIARAMSSYDFARCRTFSMARTC